MKGLNISLRYFEMATCVAIATIAGDWNEANIRIHSSIFRQPARRECAGELHRHPLLGGRLQGFC